MQNNYNCYKSNHSQVLHRFRSTFGEPVYCTYHKTLSSLHLRSLHYCKWRIKRLLEQQDRVYGRSAAKVLHQYRSSKPCEITSEGSFRMSCCFSLVAIARASEGTPSLFSKDNWYSRGSRKCSLCTNHDWSECLLRTWDQQLNNRLQVIVRLRARFKIFLWTFSIFNGQHCDLMQITTLVLYQDY